MLTAPDCWGSSCASGWRLGQSFSPRRATCRKPRSERQPGTGLFIYRISLAIPTARTCKMVATARLGETSVLRVPRHAYCPGAGNQSASNGGKPWRCQARSTRQSPCDAPRSGESRCLQSVDGSMRGKALFPEMGQCLFRDSPSQEG